MDHVDWLCITAFVLGVMVLSLPSCAVPPIEEILPKDGISCKAAITMPADARAGETVNVDVRIYDCKEKKPKIPGLPQ